MSLLLRDVEVDGRRTSVRVDGSRVSEVGPDLEVRDGAIVEGHGGALLPGLHDHHVHLLATAADRASVDCSTPAGLAALATAPGTGWVRGVRYHESVSGTLDRSRLDQLVSHRPVRVQHRSGALWMLNSRALDLAAPALDGSADVERDEHGRPTGRLWRFDDRLRRVLPHDPPDLDALAATLTALGITGVTDATPALAPEAVDLIHRHITPAADVTLLGATGPLPTRLSAGPAKILVRDHDLPSFDDLRRSIAAHHDTGRAVAVHCVTRESLLLTLAVLDEVGVVAGDRIEHAAVVPPGTAGRMAALGLAVVTQPGFLRVRGDDYLRDVDPDDVPHLYPYEGLRRAGVRVTSSSDAPYGDLDPWRGIADAVARVSGSGRVIGDGERVPAATALAGYLSPAHDPGGMPRRVAVGVPADLCLLDQPLDKALQAPSRDRVRAVVRRGEVQFRSS